MKIWNFAWALAACTLLGQAAWAAPDLTVENAVLLMRHGVRPPTHEPALDPAVAPDVWPVWEVPDGYLTPHGAQAITLLAAYDRQMLAAKGVLPASACPAAGAVEIYADVDERTVKTGEAFAAGLAPGCNIAVGHSTTKPDKLFSPLDEPDKNFDAPAAAQQMLAAAGGDINKPVSENAALFQKMQDALEPGGKAFLQLPASLKIKDPHKLPKLAGPITVGASGGEDFLLEYLDGKPMSDVGWGRVNKADVAALLALHPLNYIITARPAYIANHTAAPMAARILAALSAPGKKFTVLVGHDTNIADLGGMLGLHWQLGGYPADDPPPGGGILFLFSHGSAGKQYVTAFYQVQEMDQIRDLTVLSLKNPPALQAVPIPGCGNSTAPTACSLARFTALTTTQSK